MNEIRVVHMKDELNPLTDERHVVLSATESLTLKCGESIVKLSPDGVISISGLKIHILGDKEVILQGGSICLNEPVKG